ncbi:MAG: glycosyltransferase family 2 protein [Candidatus Bathyarchaeota archaeon]|nr:glycosyltransferase family 2 protein [Candidatus Bathyarchaeota archaeon]
MGMAVDTDISIFIPVFRESSQIAGMLDELAAQNVSKEIFVTVDQPTDAFLEEIKTLERPNVQFVVNKERVGKANALNSTVKLSSGKVLVFLDSDVSIPNDPDYLRKIVMKTQTADVVDIKKRVTKDKSFLSKMAYYEYLTFNISSWLASRYMHKCPAVNGAAFAIKRETFEKVHGFRKVVAEDIDIATRAFLEDSSFAYTHDVEVQNVVHSDWKKWFTQRRRWAIGQALWLKDWWRDLVGRFVKKPQVFLPSLFFLYPSVAVFMLSAMIPSLWMYNGLLVFSLFLSVKFNIALPIFLLSLATADILKILLISMTGFAITAAVFYGFSRKLGFREVKLHELFVYYFFYSSIWMIIIVIGHIQVLALGKKAGPDWKT